MWRLTAQTKRSVTSRTKRTKKLFALQQLLRCGYCERPLIGEVQKGKVYYRCHHRGLHTSNCVRESSVLEQIAKVLSGAKLSATEQELIRRLLAVETTSMRRTQLRQKAAKRLARGKLESKKKKALEAFLSGVFDEEVYKSVERKVTLDLALLDEKERDDRIPYKPDKVQAVLNLLERLDSALLSKEPEDQREMLISLFSNFTVQEKIVEAQPRKWLDLVLSRDKFARGTDSTALGRTLLNAIAYGVDDCLSLFDHAMGDRFDGPIIPNVDSDGHLPSSEFELSEA